MANKNITMRILDDDGAYDKLYPQTSATQSEVSADTQQLFGQSDVNTCLDKLADTISTLGRVVIKVVDANNNPIEGAVITGISGQNITDAQGGASGILTTNPITVKSPYVDLQDMTVDASKYAGSFNTLTITLPIVGENSIRRFTTSQPVKFSKMTKTVDVCCVGGGGGGTVDNHWPLTGGGWSGGQGCGGGGGAIVNGYGLSITALTSYPVVIGNGAIVVISDPSIKGQGGTTSFLTVSAQGGYSGYFERVETTTSYYYNAHSGTAGATGCGDGGGGSNTTISEFNDGKTFYSGGGGNGFQNGGSPNGANGVSYSASYPYYPVNATAAGIGGGGGGGGGTIIDGDMRTANGSAGGNGLVAIRFHF